MATTIMDGKILASDSERSLVHRVDELKNKGINPCLATVLVGDDPASATYVKMKQNTCKRLGIKSLAVELASNTSTEELLKKISELNSDHLVHGILLQHPVPKQIDERKCFNHIDVAKDVDGVTTLKALYKLALINNAKFYFIGNGCKELTEEIRYHYAA